MLKQLKIENFRCFKSFELDRECASEAVRAASQLR